MSCSPFDLRDYFLKELTDPQQRQVESHVKTCQPCREEMDRLRLTEAALFSLRDEEIPQRIAFVSDPVFEPSPWRRAWSGFWGSASRLGFASAAMLSAALVVFSVMRPAPASQIVPVAPIAAVVSPAPPVSVQAVSEADIQARIDAAVAKVVEVKTRELVSEVHQTRQLLMLATEEFEKSQKRGRTQFLAASDYGPPAEPGVAK
jgi:anti-sigma factor RsiW